MRVGMSKAVEAQIAFHPYQAVMETAATDALLDRAEPGELAHGPVPARRHRFVGEDVLPERISGQVARVFVGGIALDGSSGP